MRIERDGIPLHLSRRKVELLLAYLLLHPEEHTRDQLATLFWGDSSDAQARHSLRTALATVRKEVAADLLLADRDGVRYNPAFPCWVDLYELLALAADLESLDSALLPAKLQGWQDDLLAGCYDEWVTLAREHYRLRLLKLCLQAIQTLRARSAYAEAIAVAQQVLVRDPANEQAHQHLMFCYMAAGDRSAALRQYELCVRALLAELDVPPMPETTAFYEWLKQADGLTQKRDEARPLAAKITNLPIPLTSFVGRTHETATAKQLLTPAGGNTRLLTLTGAGGSGKTRLAIQVATDLIDRFAHGVWWVELATLTEGAQVARAVIKTLGVTERADESAIQSLSNFLGEKQLLLVIDNCEHLIEPCAQLVVALLSCCPQLQILTTSREGLNVAGELIWPVPTLGVPAAQQVVLTDLLLQFECIRLFVERAGAVQPAFRLTLENAPAVVEICTQLDGIPLAIELAAARIKVLPAAQLAARLTSAIGARFDLLTQGSRTALPRQQTLRAAIDWSYELLDEAERHLFRTVAVFRGGFPLEALEQIFAASASPPGAIPDDQGAGEASAIHHQKSSRPKSLDLLTQLVDKSLIIVEQQDGQNRYRLLETLREYGLEQFPTLAELHATQRRHAAFFLAWAEQAAPNLLEMQQQEWLNRFEREHLNLRAALDYWITQGEHEQAMRLAVAAVRFWGTRSYVGEGCAWFRKVLAKRAGVPIQYVAKALNAAGFLHFRQSDFAEAMALFQQGFELFQQIEDEKGLAEILQNMALVEIPQGQFAIAGHHLEQSLALCHRLNDEYGLARVQQHLGHLAYDQNRFTEARDYFVESLARYRALGDQVRIANLLLNLGNTVKLLGDVSTALAYQQECLAIGRAIGHKGIIGTALRSLGLHAIEQKAYAQARRYAEESLQLTRAIGDKSNMGFAFLLLGAVASKVGENKQALSYYCQNLQIMVELKYKWPIYDVLERIAMLLIDSQQQPQAAARFLGVAQRIRQDIGNHVDEAKEVEYIQHVTTLRQQLGDSVFDRLWEEGRTAPLAQIMVEASQLVLT